MTLDKQTAAIWRSMKSHPSQKDRKVLAMSKFLRILPRPAKEYHAAQPIVQADGDIL